MLPTFILRVPICFGHVRMLASDSVLEQVELELKLDELEARLDFLTAGAVGRWYTSQNQ